MVRAVLLNFGFRIGDMLTDNRIKLLDFHLVRHVFLILRGRIVVTRSRRRYELNLVSHRLIPFLIRLVLNGPFLRRVVPTESASAPYQLVLYSLTLCSEVRHNLLDSKLVNDPHAFRGDFELHETLFAFQPKPMLLNVRQEPAPGFVVGVRYIVSALGPLPRHLTYS